MKTLLFSDSVDEPCSGIRNMAVDEAMMETARRLDMPLFRFYTWSEPTLSLGYFQRYEDRLRHPASGRLPVVRRLTGGGAIVHDRELTYSLAVPPNHPLGAEHRLRLYETIHRAAIGVLSHWGIDAFLAKEDSETDHEKPNKDEFLCFRRIAPGDVVVQTERFGRVKLLGSAQYRDKHGTVLQHGSLLWERSAAAPELPGLKETGRKKMSVEEFRRRFIRNFMERIEVFLDIRWERPASTREMEPSIAILQEKRYADDWVKKK